jgi:outer membrane protein OmpA-like peptidoglycan-associated protein
VRGVISLNVPVTVGRGETPTALVQILRTAFRQSLIGALNTPLKAAGLLIAGADMIIPGEFGAASESLTLDFAPGSAEIDPAAHKRLEEMAELLAARPQLRLAIRGHAGNPETETAPVSAPMQEAEPQAASSRRVLPGRRGAAGATETSAAPHQTAWQAVAEARAQTVRRVLVDELGVRAEQIRLEPPREGPSQVELELASD